MSQSQKYLDTIPVACYSVSRGDWAQPRLDSSHVLCAVGGAQEASPEQFHGGVMDSIEREALASRVESAFAKLAAHKEDIEKLWVEFSLLKDGETIRGCKTKTEFCEKVLGRSIRAVQYMLDGGNHRRHETVSPVKTQSRVTISGQPFYAVFRSLQTEIRRGMELEAVQHAMDLEGVQAHRTAVWNRLEVISGEDIGHANEEALSRVKAFREAYEHHRATNNPNKPETLFLVQAVSYLCRSPKSRIVDNLIHVAKGIPPVPVIDITGVSVPPLVKTEIHPVCNPKGHMADGAEYFHREKAKLVNCTLPDEYAQAAMEADIARETPNAVNWLTDAVASLQEPVGILPAENVPTVPVCPDFDLPSKPVAIVIKKGTILDFNGKLYEVKTGWRREDDVDSAEPVPYLKFMWRRREN